MKKYWLPILAAAAALCIYLFYSVKEPVVDSPGKTVEPPGDVTKESVYICTGRFAVRYHSISGCKGLENCRGEIISVPLNKAAEINRTSCKICW
jgi:hypothetical protein